MSNIFRTDDRDLIKSLSHLPELDVKPRSAVFRYKGKDTDLPTIGKELNVQTILNGRVVQRGDQLTLSLELVDVQQNRVIWTERYERKQSDLVSLQSEIAKDISAKLKLKLSGYDEAKSKKLAGIPKISGVLKALYWNRMYCGKYKKSDRTIRGATEGPDHAIALLRLARLLTLSCPICGPPRPAQTLTSGSRLVKALLA